jgi:hypothetical protein
VALTAAVFLLPLVMEPCTVPVLHQPWKQSRAHSLLGMSGDSTPVLSVWPASFSTCIYSVILSTLKKLEGAWSLVVLTLITCLASNAVCLCHLLSITFWRELQDSPSYTHTHTHIHTEPAQAPMAKHSPHLMSKCLLLSQKTFKSAPNLF